jgi:diguanylate cyclase (GGDEF)-like protein
MPEEYKGLWDAIKSGNEWRGVFYNKKKSGEFYWERALISPIKSTQNGITHFLAIKEDISEQKRFESQLEYMANHDSLTNLFNRRRFLEELKSRLAETRRFGTPGALVFLDMDNFKYVNDTLGHHKGDELLMKFASLLRDRMRETDVLARLGGDEFAIILPRTGREQALLISEHFMKYVRDSVGPDLGDTCRVTISIGIALFPEHGSDAETLLMYADMAMYRAKEEGRNRVCLYESVHKTHIETKVNWERRICDALIKEGNFLLHLQPVRDLRRNRIAGYEALLRMKDERGEIIFPADFLAIAERFGLIHDIDRWVVRRAIFVASKLNLAAKGLRLEINLSGKAFTDQKLLPLIKREFDENKISPGIFIFEITETASIENISAATYFIDNLKEMGCRFAIDDFGIGFSSFNYLKHLPVDYLKIDGSFICNLPKSSVDRHLVRAMVEVACGIGKQTIAEYVDSEETVLLLKEYGVDYAQGYYIGKPKAWPLLLDEGREGLLIAKEKCRG